MSIHIKSEGCEDPGIKEGTCGIAYIYVNGEDKSPHSRGHNVVVVDAVTGNVTLIIEHTVKKLICPLHEVFNLAFRHSKQGMDKNEYFEHFIGFVRGS